jgi:glycosyltransferase involved in cell wall biosynthesis
MRWSVVIPVFNEAGYLPRTLGSLGEQHAEFKLIIVDNGSTDGCIEAARLLVALMGIDAVFLHEPRPGQVHALKRGIAAVETEFVAICDADTWYPPHYLASAEAMFDDGGAECVAASAWLRREEGGETRAFWSRLHRLSAARLMPRQNHTSGAAQCFRTGALLAAGGYDARIWPYVLKDHELMHRVLREGGQAYHADLWCISSGRRKSRKAVRWNLAERIAYHLTPFELKDRFFHDYLAHKFEARGQRDTVLRQRTWEEPQVQLS